MVYDEGQSFMGPDGCCTCTAQGVQCSVCDDPCSTLLQAFDDAVSTAQKCTPDVDSCDHIVTTLDCGCDVFVAVADTSAFDMLRNQYRVQDCPKQQCTCPVPPPYQDQYCDSSGACANSGAPIGGAAGMSSGGAAGSAPAGGFGGATAGAPAAGGLAGTNGGAPSGGFAGNLGTAGSGGMAGASP
jgi:hypothetical protein